MSLFKKTQSLQDSERLEDLLTEIVAQVLRDSSELTLEWLLSLKVTDLKAATTQIKTQVTFDKLPGHEIDSRPDIVITLYNGATKELIFIESKVGAKQGGTQLQRYAEQLVAEKGRKGFGKISLVFITRDYEAASTPMLQDSSFTFQTTRWFRFYNKLKAHLKMNGDGLVKQLRLFMEENHMSLGNQFRSTDLVAMENINSAIALIEETLEGEVTEKAQRIFGNAKLYKATGFYEQLRKFKRQVIFSLFGEGFELCIGYYFRQENPDEPVWVGIEFAAPVSCHSATQAFRQWGAQKSNASWTIKEYTGWVGLRRGNTIQSLMVESDHVQTAKNHFMSLLDEAEKFKKNYPELPWSTI